MVKVPRGAVAGRRCSCSPLHSRTPTRMPSAQTRHFPSPQEREQAGGRINGCRRRNPPAAAGRRQRPSVCPCFCRQRGAPGQRSTCTDQVRTPSLTRSGAVLPEVKGPCAVPTLADTSPVSCPPRQPGEASASTFDARSTG